MPKKPIFRTGEKPGQGTYRCTICGLNKVLDNDTNTLPPCSTCGGDVDWAKLKQSS